ncbi:MAG: SRPBCC family protein [Acidimicrobiia bacterium]|jgi:hypothetical protein
MTYPVRPVTVTARVEADPDEVFAFVSDTRNDPVWCPNVTDVSQTEGSGVSLGSRFRFHQSVETGGRTLVSDVDVEVVELAERSIVWRVEDRFQIREIRLSVADEDEASLVTQTTKAAFKRKPGLTRWVYPMMAKRVFRDQLNRLAEHFG